MALWRTSDLGMGRCRCSLDDVHGPLEHERPDSSSLQGPCALILGQPPRSRGKGLSVIRWTVCASMIFTSLIARILPYCGDFVAGSMTRSKLNFTSSALN